MALRQTTWGLMAVAGICGTLSTLSLGGCSTVSDPSAEGGGPTTNMPSSSAGAGGEAGAGAAVACGDFALTPIAWRWSWYDEDAGVYTFSTLLEANGPPDCFHFTGYDLYDELVFVWAEGESIDLYRPADSNWHSGFGPRACDEDGCIIGDIFQSNFVWAGFPDNELLQQLVSSYGPPDEACGHVFNLELVERIYCAPLADPP